MSGINETYRLIYENKDMMMNSVFSEERILSLSRWDSLMSNS